MKEKLLEYFKGDQLAADAWEAKYALKDSQGNILEETPDEMHMRMAKEFARIDIKYAKSYKGDYDKLSKLGEERALEIEHLNLEELVERYYQLFKDFKYVIPGGSVMEMLGNPYKIGSLSNCFVISSPKDSYNGIMLRRTDQVNLMKRRGGVGKDLSNIRPSGSIVNNAARFSTGASGFMEGDSNLTNEVAQDGRRGEYKVPQNYVNLK